MNSSSIQIEAYTKAHWSAQDRENVALTLGFVQKLMNAHDLESVAKLQANAPYVQHNRNMEDGVEGVSAYFRKLTKQFPEFAYEVKKVYVDGDCVTLHSHATVNKHHRGNERKGFNIIDTWRIEDGRLVEHWDAIQPLDNFMRFYYWLSGGAIRNSNGVF